MGRQGDNVVSQKRCLARMSLSRCPVPAVAGVTASSRMLYLALASARSSLAVVRLAILMSSATAPTRVDRSRSTRVTSRSSSRASSRQSLHSSTVVKGSTKTVAPVFDASWTMPATRCRLSALTGTTSLSPLTEIIGSWRASLPVFELMKLCRASVTRSWAVRTWLRSALRDGVASSATSPRTLIFERICRRSSLRSGISPARSAISGATRLALEIEFRALLWTSSEPAIASSSPPLSMPPRAARVTSSVVSESESRLRSPISSSRAQASAVSSWSLPNFVWVERGLYLKSESPGFVKRGLVSEPLANLIEIQEAERRRAQIFKLGGLITLRFRGVEGMQRRESTPRPIVAGGDDGTARWCLLRDCVSLIGEHFTLTPGSSPGQALALSLKGEGTFESHFSFRCVA